MVPQVDRLELPMEQYQLKKYNNNDHYKLKHRSIGNNFMVTVLYLERVQCLSELRRPPMI